MSTALGIRTVVKGIQIAPGFVVNCDGCLTDEDQGEETFWFYFKKGDKGVFPIQHTDVVEWSNRYPEEYAKCLKFYDETHSMLFIERLKKAVRKWSERGNP